MLSADESQWVTSGYVAWRLLRELAPPSRWETAFDERQLADWGNKNPPLGKYVIGVAVASHVRSDADVMYHWAFFRPPHKPGPPNKAPPPDMLVAARTAVALCGALALLACWLVALELLGASAWAALAPLCLFLVPGFQHYATRVATDAPQLALLGFCSHALLAHARTGRDSWLALAAVCGGLACAVKFSAGVFCLAVLLRVGRSALARRAPLRRVFAAVVLPALGFVAVNPYLYDAPVTKTVRLVNEWRISKALQQQHPVVADQAVHGPLSGLGLMSLRGALSPASAPFPQSAASAAWWERTPRLLALAGVALAALAAAGRRPSVRGPPARLALLLGALGLGVAAEKLATGALTGFGGLCGLGLGALVAERAVFRPRVLEAFCWLLGVSFVATALWLPFDWSRYYLPTLSLVAPLYAAGAAALARVVAWRGELELRGTRGLVAVLAVLLLALDSAGALASLVTPPLLEP